MSRGAQLMVVVLTCAAPLSMVGCRTKGPSGSGPASKPDQNVLLHAPATIVSVEERAHDEQSEDLLPGPRVCYTIDSFAEIPASKRSACETAERSRTDKQGPRCYDTALDPSAVHFKAGDHADVYFMLQGGTEISIVRISTHGVDL